MRWSIFRNPAASTDWSISACVRRRIIHGGNRDGWEAFARSFRAGDEKAVRCTPETAGIDGISQTRERLAHRPLLGNSSYRPETTASVGRGRTVARDSRSKASPVSKRTVCSSFSPCTSARPRCTFVSLRSRNRTPCVSAASCSTLPAHSGHGRPQCQGLRTGMPLARNLIMESSNARTSSSLRRRIPFQPIALM